MKKKLILIFFIAPSLISAFAQSPVAIELFNKANAKIGTQDYQEAVNMFSKALTISPDFKQAYKNRGIAYSLLSKNKEAILDFTKAIRLDDSDPYLYNYRGLAKSTIAKEKRDTIQLLNALKDMDKAISLRDNEVDFYLNKGIALLFFDRYDAAIQEFNAAIDLEPKHAKAHHDRGIAYSYLGKEIKACLDWKKAKAYGFTLSKEALSKKCE